VAKLICTSLCRCQEHKSLALRKEGSGIVLDSQLPYLFCIDDNVLRTGLVLYHLKVTDSLLLWFRSVLVVRTYILKHQSKSFELIKTATVSEQKKSRKEQLRSA